MLPDNWRAVRNARPGPGVPVPDNALLVVQVATGSPGTGVAGFSSALFPDDPGAESVVAAAVPDAATVGAGGRLCAGGRQSAG